MTNGTLRPPASLLSWLRHATFGIVGAALFTTACATTSSGPQAESEASASAPKTLQKLSREAMKEARMNAQVVAGTWLLDVDRGDFATSWETAASRLQNTVGKGDWTKGLTGARGSFGALTRRHFVKTRYTNKLQPAGQYVVVSYHSLFENAPALESVTVVQDEDNQWRVVMYGIEKTKEAPPEDAPAEGAATESEQESEDEAAPAAN